MLRASPPRAPPSSWSRSGASGSSRPPSCKRARCSSCSTAAMRRLAAEPTTDPEYLDAWRRSALLRRRGRAARQHPASPSATAPICAALEHARAAGDAGEGARSAPATVRSGVARAAATACRAAAAGPRRLRASELHSPRSATAARAAARRRRRRRRAARRRGTQALRRSEAGEPVSAADDGDAAVCAGARALAIDLLVRARARGPQGVSRRRRRGGRRGAPSALCTLYEAL